MLVRASIARPRAARDDEGGIRILRARADALDLLRDSGGAGRRPAGRAIAAPARRPSESPRRLACGGVVGEQPVELAQHRRLARSGVAHHDRPRGAGLGAAIASITGRAWRSQMNSASARGTEVVSVCIVDMIDRCSRWIRPGRWATGMGSGAGGSGVGAGGLGVGAGGRASGRRLGGRDRRSARWSGSGVGSVGRDRSRLGRSGRGSARSVGTGVGSVVGTGVGSVVGTGSGSSAGSVVVGFVVFADEPPVAFEGACGAGAGAAAASVALRMLSVRGLVALALDVVGALDGLGRRRRCRDRGASQPAGRPSPTERRRGTTRPASRPATATASRSRRHWIPVRSRSPERCRRRERARRRPWRLSREDARTICAWLLQRPRRSPSRPSSAASAVSSDDVPGRRARPRPMRARARSAAAIARVGQRARGAERDDRLGVGVDRDRAVEPLGEELRDARNPGRAAGEQDRLEVGAVHARGLERVREDVDRALDAVLDHLLEFGARESHGGVGLTRRAPARRPRSRTRGPPWPRRTRDGARRARRVPRDRPDSSDADRPAAAITWRSTMSSKSAPPKSAMPSGSPTSRTPPSASLRRTTASNVPPPRS